MLELIGFIVIGFVIGLISGIILCSLTVSSKIADVYQENMSLMKHMRTLDEQKLELLRDIERMRDGLQSVK